jgi:hypothetical protein
MNAQVDRTISTLSGLDGEVGHTLKTGWNQSQKPVQSRLCCLTRRITFRTQIFSTTGHS